MRATKPNKNKTMNRDIPYELPIETLTAIKNELPYGSLLDIAEKEECSRDFVSKVFNGEVPISKTAYRIIREAQRIILDQREKSQKLNAELLKTLGK